MTTVSSPTPRSRRRRRRARGLPGPSRDRRGDRRRPDRLRDVYGSGEPTIVLLPSTPIVHSRQWKGQVPYLSRHYRVVAFDGRGNGRSDRPTDPAALPRATGWSATSRPSWTPPSTDAAVLVGLCGDGVWRAIELAAATPERVAGIVAFAAGVPLLSPPHPWKAPWSFEDELPTDEGWAKQNRHYWRRDYPGFARFFFEEITSEPHSTKQIDDAVEWALDGSVDAMLADDGRRRQPRPREVEAICRAVRCPMLLVHGTEDTCQPLARVAAPVRTDRRTARRRRRRRPHDPRPPSGPGQPAHPRLRPIHSGGPIHDRAIRHAAATRRPRTWTRALARRRRALYLSSPIGLGHAQRDVAIADELRALRPDLEIDWLAQHPVTTVLEARGERIHPLSAELASRIRPHRRRVARARPQRLPGDPPDGRDPRRQLHGLPRRVEAGEYDLVIGDEAWDVDHFLHENPELKRTAFAWMTDFVGWLPMPSGGEREAFLTADYNAEMIEHVERFPRLRDRAIFVGDPDDIVPDDFGPGLPSIRDWTERHYAFSGLRDRVRPGAADRASRGAAARARLPTRRARRHRHGRRLGRRRGPAAAGHRELPGCARGGSTACG